MGIFDIVNELSKALPVINLIPVMILFAIIFNVLSKLTDTSDMYTDDIKFNYNRLKFWEWQLRYYIPFYFITIILTHIINRGLGFIISIILSIVTIVKMIGIWIGVKKGGV